MIEQKLQDAIFAAIVQNELGGNMAIATELRFAGVDNSGGSYGVLQNDCYANPKALQMLGSILRADGLGQGAVGPILALLGRPCKTDPLTPGQLALVNGALLRRKSMIGELDDFTFEIVLSELELAISAAAAVGNGIETPAEIAIALWCNMTGRPTLLSTWLSGQAVTENGILVGAPGTPVTLADIHRYLLETKFFRLHPQNDNEFLHAVQVGVAKWAAA